MTTDADKLQDAIAHIMGLSALTVRMAQDHWRKEAALIAERDDGAIMIRGLVTERDEAKARCDLAVRIAERVQDERDEIRTRALALSSQLKRAKECRLK